MSGIVTYIYSNYAVAAPVLQLSMRFSQAWVAVILLSLRRDSKKRT